jgi:hypothetical protein
MPTQRTQALYNPVLHHNDTRRRHFTASQDYRQSPFFLHQWELTRRMLKIPTRLDPYEDIHLHIAYVDPCI